jgi:hypothetical protein
MTAGELIAALQNMDPETPVFFAYNYGDYNRTEAADPVRQVQQLDVTEWAYGNCHRTLDRYDEDESETDKEAAIPAIVLK